MIDSIKETFKERISSPIAGSFLFAWIILNWKVIYITIFSDSSELGMSKLKYIETYLYSVKDFFWLPLVYTFIIIVIYPIANTLASMVADFVFVQYNKFKGIYLAPTYVHKSEVEKRDLEIEGNRKRFEELKRSYKLDQEEWAILKSENKELIQKYSLAEKDSIDDKKEISRLKLEINRIQELEVITDVYLKNIQGTWRRRLYKDGTVGHEEEVIIKGNKMNAGKISYLIDMLEFNKETTFIKFRTYNDEVMHIHELNISISKKGKLMDGKIDRKLIVDYELIDGPYKSTLKMIK